MIRREQVVWFAWLPRWTALAPLAVYAAGFGALCAGTHFLGEDSTWVWQLILATLYIIIPGYLMLIAGQPITRALGITDESWQQAIGVGAVLGILLGGAQLYRHVSAGQMLIVPELNLSLLSLVLSIALIVAGDEVLLRGGFSAVLEPAIGFVPTLVLSALAYTLLPLAMGANGQGPQSSPYLPAGYMPPFGSGFLLLFIVGLFLFGIYRLTGSLWASATANFIARFALAFAWAPAAVTESLSTLNLAIAAALWIVAILGLRRWMTQADARHQGPAAGSACARFPKS